MSGQPRRRRLGGACVGTSYKWASLRSRLTTTMPGAAAAGNMDRMAKAPSVITHSSVRLSVFSHHVAERAIRPPWRVGRATRPWAGKSAAARRYPSTTRAGIPTAADRSCPNADGVRPRRTGRKETPRRARFRHGLSQKVQAVSNHKQSPEMNERKVEVDLLTILRSTQPLVIRSRLTIRWDSKTGPR